MRSPVRLLCDLQNSNIPDDDEFYDSVATLMDIAIDLESRMVSADVIMKDIIKMYVEPHEDDMYIYLQLTMLKWLKNSICYERKKLDEIYRKVRTQFLQ